MYSTAQRGSALPRNSSSEQEIGSSYLEFKRRTYSPTTVAPSSNASHVERSSARTMFTISWLNPSDKPNTACQCKAAPLALSSTERRAKEPFAWVRPPAPSKPTEATLGFDPAEKKLTPLPVLRYSSGHRKRWFKNPVHATIVLTVEGTLLARSYCTVVRIRTRSLIFGRQEGF